MTQMSDYELAKYLQEQLDEAKSALAWLNKQTTFTVKECFAECEKLRKALEGKHDGHCAETKMGNGHGPCDCGTDAALASPALTVEALAERHATHDAKLISDFLSQLKDAPHVVKLIDDARLETLKALKKRMVIAYAYDLNPLQRVCEIIDAEMRDLGAKR